MYTLVAVADILFVKILVSKPGPYSKVNLSSMLFRTRLVWDFWSNVCISESNSSSFWMVGPESWWEIFSPQSSNFCVGDSTKFFKELENIFVYHLWHLRKLNHQRRAQFGTIFQIALIDRLLRSLPFWQKEIRNSCWKSKKACLLNETHFK